MQRCEDGGDGALIAGTPATTAVGDVCSAEPATVLADSDVRVADGIMRDLAVRRLLVVGADDRPQGVVTINDLVMARGEASMIGDIVRADPPRQA